MKANIVKRLIAFVIDYVIAMVLVGIGVAILAVSAIIDNSLVTLVAWLLAIVLYILPFAYILLKDGLFGGRSLGKKIMKLKVVTKDGQPCNMVKSIIRNIFLCISIIEAIIVLIDKEGDRLGDKVAGTHVSE